MKAYIIVSTFSAVWIVMVYMFLSDYYWYQRIAAGTWGFILVNAITLIPVLLCFFIADRLQPVEKSVDSQ
ncbi:hypothetical protein BK120_00200 [Paenibacillus sp. FSL A5-0031]|uniref:hypothetical protein n=1 Tax=Paenibacillus sp. FSL A5-0031 TaxID=1920420 RepID=UPI00096EBECA|nr:hypothetical protein [Paenibacillus sp. FSL A5-0031]OME87793.1 hypothetical protein BK120_00200 [Paenibacillus sp. FSL A5-0031]